MKKGIVLSVVLVTMSNVYAQNNRLQERRLTEQFDNITRNYRTMASGVEEREREIRLLNVELRSEFQDK